MTTNKYAREDFAHMMNEEHPARTTLPVVVECDPRRVRSYEELPMQVKIHLDLTSLYTNIVYHPGEPLVYCTFYGNPQLENLRADPRFNRGGLTVIPEWIPVRIVRGIDLMPKDGRAVIEVRNPVDGIRQLSITGTNLGAGSYDYMRRVFEMTRREREVQSLSQW